MIVDSLAFLNNKRVLSIPLKDGSNRVFSIALNFSTELYLKMISSLVLISTTEDVIYRVQLLFDICADILKTCDETITSDYLEKNVEFEDVMEIVIKIANALNGLIENDAFEIPDIKPKSKEVLKDKERQKTRDDIEHLQNQLKGNQDIHLIDDVVIVMEKTGSSFEDVMRMPILIFKDVLRSIVITNKRQDDDYNLAYLQYEYNNLREKVKSGKAIEPQTPKKKEGVDLNKLKQMLG